MAGNQDYLSPKVKSPQSRIVQQFNNQGSIEFRNAPAFPEYGGFADKGCLHMKHATPGVDRVPSVRAGRPI